ncbi:hypothetical protein B0H12DRAFT_97384 [Mycena haematopus]|nr:hypothetical protein B0H12DRAFT_97384 [Mycena haematopus]
MGGRVFVPPKPAPLVADVPQPTRQRRDFQCPAEDKEGSSLTGQNVNADNDGTTSTVTLDCIYQGGAGGCSYSGDGSFESGSSACPDGTDAGTPSSTTVTQTQTQTEIVTKTNSQLPSSSLPPTESAPIAQTSNTGPRVVQSTPSSRNSVAPGAIAGIVLGTITVLLLVIILPLWIRRTRRRQHSSSKALRSSQTGTTENSRTVSVSIVQQNRQEYLAGRLHAVQKELEALQASVGTGSDHLEQAMQQNEALRTRIRMLEGEMQSQWGLGLTDSPPTYLDSLD